MSSPRALLLSLLVRQRLALGDKFNLRYPQPWLVWEAGAWNPHDTGEQNVATTLLPETDLRDCLPEGDAVCFELAPPTPGRAEALQLGRASHNTFVINDATVSREHLVLRRSEQGAWSVELLAQASGPATLDDAPLPVGEPRPLRAGARLGMGEVRLTFHGSQDFAERIARIASLAVKAGAR